MGAVEVGRGVSGSSSRLGTAAGPRDVGLSIGTSACWCVPAVVQFYNPAIFVALHLEPPLECGSSFPYFGRQIYRCTFRYACMYVSTIPCIPLLHVQSTER